MITGASPPNHRGQAWVVEPAATISGMVWGLREVNIHWHWDGRIKIREQRKGLGV